MSEKGSIEIYNQMCRDLDKAQAKIKKLKTKYEKPGQKCNAGHVNNLPIKLWDCPVCTSLLNDRIKELMRENKLYRGSISRRGI